MNKFTVIIPTMLKSYRLFKLISSLQANEYVQEIIIIKNTAQDLEISNHSKLNIVCFEENIGVNPAWNLGVTLAKTNHVCIANDDIDFDMDIFQIFSNFDYLPNGIIGIDYSCYFLEKSDTNLVYLPISERPNGWGCLLIFNRDQYVPIPEEMKIACGDDWLLWKMGGAALYGLHMETEMSTTSRYFLEQAARDLEIFNGYKNSNH